MSDEELSGEQQWENLYNIKAVSEGDQVDITTLLYPSGSGILQKNNGDKIPVESLKGKIVGFYFASASNSVCQSFTPLLVQAYNDLLTNEGFEIVFLSCDDLMDVSQQNFSTMPSSWLAFPFYENIYNLMLKVAAICIPHLVFFSENGEVLTLQGFQIISDYGSAAFPFCREKIQSFIEEEKRHQTLRSILATKTRDFVISSDGSAVPISDIEGKTVGLYFWSYSSSVFTQTLAKVYEELKEKGDLFEIVMVFPLMDSDYSFKEAIASAPWLTIPLNDTKCTSLIRYFGVSTSPNLTIIAPDGQTLNPNAVEAVTNHESLAFPFTPERIAELDAIRRGIEESQTLASLLVSADRDFVINNNGSRIAVSSLEGKTVMLYFSEMWGDLTLKLFVKEAYRELKAKEAEFEVILVSTDKDESNFESYMEEMPWLALPFGDDRRVQLGEYFKVRELPMVVAIGPSGRTIAKDARKIVSRFGAYGYPFTEERIKEIEDESEEKIKGWPEKTYNLSAHINNEIELSYWEEYTCDRCQEKGELWSYICAECSVFIHPKCALDKH